jgi:hypothetical protein
MKRLKVKRLEKRRNLALIGWLDPPYFFENLF